MLASHNDIQDNEGGHRWLDLRQTALDWIHRPRRVRHRCLSVSRTISTTTPAASVNARSSACSGPNRNSALAAGQRRLKLKITVTVKRIHASAGLGRRNAATSDALNERLTRIRLKVERTSEKNVRARTSSS